MASVLGLFVLHAGLFCLTDSGDFLRPFSLAFVKGWRRSVTCLIALEGIRSLGIALDEVPKELKAAVQQDLVLNILLQQNIFCS